jgi:biopolymer transport protein ExbD
MKRRGLEPMHDEHVNVTPLIDVVMCLIIFFLTCSHLARTEANDKVILPRAELGRELAEQRGRVVINVSARAAPTTQRAPGPNAGQEPVIIIREKKYSIQALTDFLLKEKQDSPDLQVILRADEDLAYDWISPVLVSCFRANIKSIHFSTRQE